MGPLPKRESWPRELKPSRFHGPIDPLPPRCMDCIPSCWPWPRAAMPPRCHGVMRARSGAPAGRSPPGRASASGLARRGCSGAFGRSMAPACGPATKVALSSVALPACSTVSVATAPPLAVCSAWRNCWGSEMGLPLTLSSTSLATTPALAAGLLGATASTTSPAPGGNWSWARNVSSAGCTRMPR